MLQSFFVNHLCHRCCSCCRCGVAVVAFFLVCVVVDGGGDGVGGVRVGVGGVRAGVVVAVEVVEVFEDGKVQVAGVRCFGLYTSLQ